MSTTTIRELLVKLGVDAGDSSEQLEKVDAGIDAVIGVAVAGVAVVATLTAGLYALATGAAEAADTVQTNSQKTGVAVEQYQELAYAASQSNVETADLNAALVKQGFSLAEAADGTEAMVEAYDALGLSQEDLAGMSTDEALLATADALAATTDEQERLQLATAIYGSELAAKMLPLLGQGADGISALMDEANALGIVMSEEDVEAAAEFNDQLDSLWAVITSVRNEIGLKLIPFLTSLTTGVKEWVSANRELIDQKLTAWTDAIVSGLETVWDTVVAVDEVVQRVFGGWGPILGVAAGIVATLGAAFVAIQAASFWGTISTAVTALGALFGATFGQVLLIAGAVVAAIVALGLVVQDLWTYFQGGNSVFGELLTKFPALQSFVSGLSSAFTSLVAVAQQLWGVIQVLGAAWYQVFSVTTLPVIKLVGAAMIWLATEAFGLIGWWLDNIVTPGLNLMAEGLAWVEQKASSLMGTLGAVTGVLNGLLGGLSAVTGVDLTTGSSGTTAATGATIADTAVFGPSAAEVAGGTSSTSSTATTVNKGGDTYNVSGLGLSQEQVEEAIANAQKTAAAQTAAAVEGATV